MDPQKIQLVPGSDGELRLKNFLRQRVKAIREGLNELHTNKLVVWRKAYEAVPAERVREFPWHNASNLVVPIIAIHSDTLLARVMSAIIKTKPLWITRVIGDHGEEADGWRSGLEEYGNYVGLEPQELDLYRVYHEWFGEAIRLGTSIVKSPWIRKVEDTLVPAGDGMGTSYEFDRKTTYEGPRPEKIPFEDFGISPAARTVEQADFKYHRIRLQRHEIEERVFRRVYDSAPATVILKQPDRTSPDYVRAQKEMDAGARTVTSYGWAEWDIYECHAFYKVDTSHYCKIIAWYHEKSNEILRAFYFYYPEEIFVAARLFYRDDMFHGYGFCETLSMLQEEISQIHNQRRDNMTVANMKMFRVDPDSKLHQGYKSYPSAMLPARENEIEPLEFGTPVVGEIDSERLTLELAEKRSGVSPPMQGSGSGFNTKRGVYTAMGTLSLLQEGNTRTDLNVTDIRYAHTRLGRLLFREYAEFGNDSEFQDRRLAMFGKSGDRIRQALEALRDNKVAIPVYGSTASVNREVEKQNDLMLSTLMTRHYQTITQMLQAAQNQMQSPESQQYLKDAIKSSNLLMQMVIRHFGYDEVERLVPEPKLTQPQGGQPQMGAMTGQPQQQPQLGPGPQAGNGEPMPQVLPFPINMAQR
jgi:hypothetical protein